MDDPILIWNEISLEANRVSHTDGSKEQNGPTLSSRALAIVHLAMYDAYAGIDKAANLPPYFYPGITSLPNTPENVAAAVAGAAYTTLVALYPSQLEYFDQQLALHGNRQKPAHQFGVAVAHKILEFRQNDPGASQGIFRPVKKRGIHKVGIQPR